MVRARHVVCIAGVVLWCGGMAWAAPPPPPIHVQVIPAQPMPAAAMPGGMFVAADPEELPPGAEGTWLGIQLTPLPAAVASHLQLDGNGLMVRNVYKDSPADRAGIERYDVVVEAEGQKVPSDVAEFSKHVRRHEVGESLKLTLYRKGKRITIEARLEKAPEGNPRSELKYPDDEPDVLRSRNFGMRGRILRPGPDGWVMEDLGNLPGADRLMWLWGEEGRGSDDKPAEMGAGRRVEKDGSVLSVRRHKDGTIEVKRFKRDETDAKAEVKTYRDMDELKNADAKAYEFLRQIEQSGRKLPLPKKPGMMTPPQPPDAPMWSTPAPPHGSDAESWRKWRDRFFQGPLKELKNAPLPWAAPNTRFDVDEDGRITTHVRKGDTEMNMTFRNEEAFKQRAPDLHKQFKEMEQQIK